MRVLEWIRKAKNKKIKNDDVDNEEGNDVENNVDIKKKRKSELGNKEDNNVEGGEEEDEGPKYSYSRPTVSYIKNKTIRAELNAKLKSIKVKEKKKRIEKRKREGNDDGENPLKKQRTLENTREPDDTMVLPNDNEVIEDEAGDEFAEYFKGNVKPKIFITTSNKRTQETRKFVDDLVRILPNTFYYDRMNVPMKNVINYCKKKEFTDIIVINEDNKRPNGLLLVHLPNGPTALFRLSSVQCSKEILNHGATTDHNPEVFLNNFNTRLGHTVGRMLGSLLPSKPQFRGRRIVTFYNQRDFIFFKHHRYIFDDPKKVRMQEIGPRFTLRLKYLQHGTFDRKFGEYEWIEKKELITSRRRFFL